MARTPSRGTIFLPLAGDLREVGAVDLDTVPPTDVAWLRVHDARTVTGEMAAALQAGSGAVPHLSDGPPWLEAPAVGRRSVVRRPGARLTGRRSR